MLQAAKREPMWIWLAKLFAYIHQYKCRVNQSAFNFIFLRRARLSTANILIFLHSNGIPHVHEKTETGTQTPHWNNHRWKNHFLVYLFLKLSKYRFWDPNDSFLAIAFLSPNKYNRVFTENFSYNNIWFALSMATVLKICDIFGMAYETNYGTKWNWVLRIVVEK